MPAGHSLCDIEFVDTASGVETLPLTVTCGLGLASEVETLPLGVTCGLGSASGFAAEVNILLAGAGLTSVAVVVCEVWSS